MEFLEKETARREGTWAHDTISRRILQDISPRIQKDNEVFLEQNPDSQRMFDELLSSLRSGENGQLTDINVDDPDSTDWNLILHSIPVEKRNWLDSPWIIAEFYYYRRLMNIFPYDDASYDLFHQQKLNGLLSAFSHFEDISMAWIQNDFAQIEFEICLKFGILTSLWGNKKDLSIWPAQQGLPSETTVTSAPPLLSAVVDNMIKNTAAHILDNHLDDIVNYLKESLNTRESRSIGIILDNAGYELLSDLFLGYILFSLNIVDKVVFYTKKHPTFVSDATTRDCLETITTLSKLESYPHCNKMGLKWKELVDSNIFIFVDDFFWCQPTGFHRLPSKIASQLENHTLTFIKGDANYRRILDDRLWPTDTPVDQVFGYWQSTVSALRALKSEVGCGITDEKKEYAQSHDPNWLVSGEWALVQFYQPR